MSRIYLSSTLEELKEYREAVRQTLRRLNHEVIGVEEFAAGESAPLKKMLEEVARADVYVGILARRYGFVPSSPDNPGQLSITELEYRHATRNGIPCLIFQLNENFPWSPQFIDRGEEAKKLSVLQAELRETQIVGIFSDPEDLATQVAASIGSIPPRKRAAPSPSIEKLTDGDLQMLSELLFRLVIRLRERPEMLQSLEATAFWAAVRKMRPGATSIEDLRSLNAELSSEPGPGALWTAWVRNTRATELAGLFRHPEIMQGPVQAA